MKLYNIYSLLEIRLIKMADLLFSFRDLTNIKDPNRSPTFNIGSLLMNDEYVRKFNPKRYAFYIKFLTGLSNPSNLYKFLYKTNESKIYHEEMANKISKVSNGLNKLSPKQRVRVLNNLKLILTDDKNKYEHLLDALMSNNRTGGANTPPAETAKPENDEKPKTYKIKKPSLPMENLILDVHNVYPMISRVPPKSIDDIVEVEGEEDDKTIQQKKNKSETEPTDDKIIQIKSIYNKYKNISQFSPDRLKITMVDRGVFIAVTFLLRLLSLSLVFWGLNSNLINNFKTAFIYYSFIYILFFIFIIGLVNIIYYYPVFELLGNTSINSYIPNLLFYFYTHMNGYNRLILHIAILLLLMFIPFVLTLDDDKNKVANDNANISYNYKLKNKIYTTISNFSLVIFALTSIVALNY
jgi:hypothetical protein